MLSPHITSIIVIRATAQIIDTVYLVMHLDTFLPTRYSIINNATILYIFADAMGGAIINITRYANAILLNITDSLSLYQDVKTSNLHHCLYITEIHYLF